MIEALRPWLESLGVLLLALLGAWGGRFFSRLSRPWWWIGYIVPMTLITGVSLTRWFYELTFTAPFSWFVAGRTRFAVLAFAGTLVLTTPLSRIRRERDRRWIRVLMVFVVGYAASPFFAEALVRDHLLSLETEFQGGVCIQSNGYTCGPAAAVTALRRLGLPAEEGELAILAHTTPTGGTQPDDLLYALERRYGGDGLRVEYRYFPDLASLQSELKDNGSEVLAVVKHSFLVDHYVTVLEILPDDVLVGDPLQGRSRWSRDGFLDKWRHSGLVLQRE